MVKRVTVSLNKEIVESLKLIAIREKNLSVKLKERL